jgi:hypothetical protein
MAVYGIINLSYETPKQDQDKLAAALKRLQGVLSVVISLPRKEVTLTGKDPNIHVLREACGGAGFQLGRRV